MGHLCLTLQQQDAKKKNDNNNNDNENNDNPTTTTQFISSSGGNAGLAVAATGQALSGCQVHVIVPETTKPLVIDKLRQTYGATVTVHGANWNAADAYARELCRGTAAAHYVSPYDNSLLWTGHSTVIDEIYQDLAATTTATSNSDSATTSPSIGTLIVSVGGGGLLCGVLEGLQRHYDKNNNNSQPTTQVIAAETVGASSFAQALQQKKLVRLDSIDSVATSLGALEVTAATLDRVESCQASSTVQAATCTDAQAVAACLSFAAEHKLLVEPACGAALAVLYSDELRNEFLANDAVADATGPIVVEVCGGSAVSVELLAQWKEQFGL